MFALMLLLCRRCVLLPGLLLTLGSTLLVAAPWHLAMHAIHGEVFVAQYFGAEIADRASGGSVVNEGGVGRWWFYIEKIFAGYWPWLIAVVCCIGAKVRGRRIGGDPRLLICAAIWTVAWLALLSVFPDRRDRYALVLYPALAIPVGAWLAYRSRPAIRSLMKGVEKHGIWFMTLTACIFAVLPVRLQRPPDPQWTELFAYLESQGNPGIWQGAMIGHRGSRIYLETGQWPVTTINHIGELIASPPGGSLIIYHDHDGQKPGPGEDIVFRAGMLTLTRLAEGSLWSPIPGGG
jgi:4-amino-4-deoxy-L-arabinose transferase-like glycosyltransferase